MVVAVALLAGCFDATIIHEKHESKSAGINVSTRGDARGSGGRRDVATLALTFRQQGRINQQDPQVEVETVSKHLLRRLLAIVAWARPAATTPERALLQTLNRHFVSPAAHISASAAAVAAAVECGSARTQRAQQQRKRRRRQQQQQQQQQQQLLQQQEKVEGTDEQEGPEVSASGL